MTTTASVEYTAPLVVLDEVGGALVAHRPDVRLVELPSDVVDLASVAEWALAYGLGSAKLSHFGEDSGPLVVLTESATKHLGLPVEITDRKYLRLGDDHPAHKALGEAGWDLSKAGLSAWTLIYRGRVECRFAFVPWGAFDENARWQGIADNTDPAALAYVLGLYAERVITPAGSTAATSLALMTAVRPATKLEFPGGKMRRVAVPGSLSKAMDPAPPEAPDEHPLAVDRTREQSRNPRHVVVCEALNWFREPTEEEGKLANVVGLDVNFAFGAGSNSVNVGLCPPVHTDGPRFDKALPGSWLCDFSGVTLRTRDLATKEWRPLPANFPSPFTLDGKPPTGPAWYPTPTVAYAAELGVDVSPIEAWLRPEYGRYFDLWYLRLQPAYMATLADLGVTEGMGEEEFIEAMATINQRDPEAAKLLQAIKATAKGGIGKMAERPQGREKREGRNAPWGALKRVTWSPHARFTVIASSNAGAHRKAVKTWNATGLTPLAVNADMWLYPSAFPTARAVVPRKADGSPLPGGWRLGPNPGYVKQEGVQSMEWYLGRLAQNRADGKQNNPGRFLKGRDSFMDGE